MRVLWVVVLAAACSKSKPKPLKPLDVVKVDTAAVLAKDSPIPPVLYLVGDEGDIRVGAAESWKDLDANVIKITKKPLKIDFVDRYAREDFALQRNPLETVKNLDEMADDPVALDLGSLEDEASRKTAAQDDPPPPEEEDKPDDGEDESEGKMGKQDSDRAEGQYKMKKTDEDPQLARQQAIEQARAAGILGNGTKGGGPPIGGMPSEDGGPARVADIEGTVSSESKLQRAHAMIVIPPAAKATRLILAAKLTDAAIAVSHGGKLRPLRLDFKVRDGFGSSPYWLEARVTSKDIAVEAVPDKPIAAETKDLAAALDKARKARGLEGDVPVDVLVDDNVDAQRLVDILVALDTAGVRHIGMGEMPVAEELARRGHRMPTAVFGRPNAQGDLDKALIRHTVKSAQPAIQACYEKALAKQPELAGTVQVQFFITPKGAVASSSGSGVDPDLATCVAGVIKNLKFPEPKGGGGVQVNYPFTMRP